MCYARSDQKYCERDHPKGGPEYEYTEQCEEMELKHGKDEKFCPPEEIIPCPPDRVALDNDEHCLICWEEDDAKAEAEKAERDRLLAEMGSGFGGQGQ